MVNQKEALTYSLAFPTNCYATASDTNILMQIRVEVITKALFCVNTLGILPLSFEYFRLQ